jgi:hypothetical protein
LHTIQYGMALGVRSGSNAAEEITSPGAESGRAQRVARLLRLVSEATAELAAEFEHGNAVVLAAPVRVPRGRAVRAVAVPQNVIDLDVQAARRALRRAGL